MSTNVEKVVNRVLSDIRYQYLGTLKSRLKQKKTMEEKINKSLLQQASRIQMDQYERPLTDEEKSMIAETMAGIMESEDQLAEEKKAQMAEYKERAKMLAASRAMYRKQKKTGRVEEAGNLYTFYVNEEGKNMAYMYNGDGKLVNSRRMYAEEIKDHQYLITEQEGVVKLNPEKAAANG